MLCGDSTSGNTSTEISHLEFIEKFKIYWKVLTANAKSWINYWHVLRGAWRPDLWPNLYVLLGFHETDESSTFDRRPCHRGSRFFKHRLGCVFLMGEWQGQVPRIGDSFSICRSKRGWVHAHPYSSALTDFTVPSPLLPDVPGWNNENCRIKDIATLRGMVNADPSENIEGAWTPPSKQVRQGKWRTTWGYCSMGVVFLKHQACPAWIGAFLLDYTLQSLFCSF